MDEHWCVGCDEVHDTRDMRWTPLWEFLCHRCVRAQCTHGVNGVWIPCCTQCGNYWNEQCQPALWIDWGSSRSVSY